jgi:hypothetical protein
MKSAATKSAAKKSAARLLARFGAFAALATIAALVFYG